MPDTTARLTLPTIAPSQAQKHVTHNEALQMLDGITQLVLSGVGSETPPAVPTLGEIHALGAAPTGAWAGQAGMLAQWVDPAWHFLAPAEGWRAWDIAGGGLVAWQAGAWVAVTPDLDNLAGVGIATTADATNRLAVASEAVLFSHAGSDHQLKLNKAGAGDSGSLLYQSGWTGHAEIGLTGDNDFHFKVSADGSAWTEALVIDAASGHLSGAAVQASATDTTPGRLARADHAYGPGNLVGTVGESGGTPTGAVIERGANANGEYVRFADGTQICWTDNGAALTCTTAEGNIFTSSSALWIYPAAFSPAYPVVATGAADSYVRWVTVASTNAANAGYRQKQGAANGSAIGTRLMATGRWF